VLTPPEKLQENLYTNLYTAMPKLRVLLLFLYQQSCFNACTLVHLCDAFPIIHAQYCIYGRQSTACLVQSSKCSFKF